MIMLAFASLLTGCDQVKQLFAKKNEPEERTYFVYFADGTEERVPGKEQLKRDESLLGVYLVVDGEDVGVIGPSQLGVGVRFSWKTKHTLSSQDVDLALRFPTPCGDHDIALEDYRVIDIGGDDVSPEEEKKRRRPTSDVLPPPYDVWIDVEGDVDAPEPFVVWVDDEDDPKAEVEVGKATITSKRLPREGRDERGHAWYRGRKQMLWDRTCADAHPVRVDGKKVGTADTTREKSKAFLISTRPNVCHALRSAVFRPVGMMNAPGESSTA